MMTFVLYKEVATLEYNYEISIYKSNIILYTINSLFQQKYLQNIYFLKSKYVINKIRLFFKMNLINIKIVFNEIII